MDVRLLNVPLEGVDECRPESIDHRSQDQHEQEPADEPPVPLLPSPKTLQLFADHHRRFYEHPDRNPFKPRRRNSVVEPSLRRLSLATRFLLGPIREAIVVQYRHQTLERRPKSATKSATTNTMNRSEERRVGKECRSRWSPY